MLVEVLMAILIIAVAFTAFMGAMSQALNASYRSWETIDAISKFESILFQIENGLRPDLAGYGGQGDLTEGYSYSIKAEKSGQTDALLQGKLSWKKGKGSLYAEFLASKAGLQ